jgi:hypothetical protein
MAPANVERLQLHQIARQDQDTITFDVSSLPSLTAEAEVFLIFYLSKEDEYNGYGTVIQLDPQTRQAAIYADLNPEYTYLFFQNDQGQLQSLLWCIEIATRTSDGLFIAHAKSYGRGISQEDIQSFSQVNLPQNQPETERRLAETYTPQPASNQNTTTAPATTPVVPQNTMQAPTPAPAAVPTPPAPATQPSVVPANPITTPASAAPTAPPTQQPTVKSTPAIPTPPAPPNPVAPPPSNSPAVTTDPFAPSTDSTGPVTEEPYLELNLPPLPTIAPSVKPKPTPPTTPPPPPVATPRETQSDLPASTNPAPMNTASIPGIPDILSSMPPMDNEVTPPPAMPQRQPTPKQPVGRPPKPLMQEQLWLVSPDDFAWVKTVSRLPIDQFKEELRQRIMKQIRQHKPGLIEDWQFHGAFEQAFIALCTTYELIPALRHDILKALLNGRVIDAVYRNMGV